MNLNDPNDVTVSWFRHLGTLLAGYLIRKGYVEASAAPTVMGATVAVGVGLLAWWNKRQANQVKAATAQIALRLPENSQPATLNSALAANALPQVNLSKA
jgi:hypothetical protein